MPTPDTTTLFNYARREALRAVNRGRGTEFPTVRHAARRFRCRQAEILAVVEAGDDLPAGASYFGLAVGFRSGAGLGEYEHQGDYRIEAYDEDASEANLRSSV